MTCQHCLPYGLIALVSARQTAQCRTCTLHWAFQLSRSRARPLKLVPRCAAQPSWLRCHIAAGCGKSLLHTTASGSYVPIPGIYVMLWFWLSVRHAHKQSIAAQVAVWCWPLRCPQPRHTLLNICCLGCTIQKCLNECFMSIIPIWPYQCPMVRAAQHWLPASHAQVAFLHHHLCHQPPVSIRMW
jgi:hypothetical protein